MPEALTDILFRGRFDRAVDLRTDSADVAESDSTTMFGYFSVFDNWYRIHSWMEGLFIERTVRGRSARRSARTATR